MRRHQVDQPLDGAVEQFGGNDQPDAEDNGYPLRGRDAEAEACGNDNHRGDEVEAEVLFLADAAAYALPGVTEAAELLVEVVVHGREK